MQTEAAIRLPSLVSDRMVLQRDTELKIWGWADAGEKVTVRFREKHYYTEADEAGKWIVQLPAQLAGGPFIMEINELILRDILIGDVWLCSGQSNMETPIARLVEKYPEISVSNQHMIRYFKVPTQNTMRQPEESIPHGGEWFSGTSSDIMNWTALAYFYAKQSYEHNGIPVGMLVSSLGGSRIESWIDQVHLQEFPDRRIDQNAGDSLATVEENLGLAGWNTREWDDTNWSETQVPGMWQTNPDLATLRGILYLRKTFDLPASMAGRHARIYLGTLVDSDSVFINGHFVGATAYMYPPRKYDIPTGILREGKNVVTVRLRSDAGNGGFVEDKKYYIQGDDLIIDLTGSWKYKVGLDLAAAQSSQDRMSNQQLAGSGLFNGMIYPIRNYQIKGAIWYQGESNTGQPQAYKTHLKNLVTNWRALWEQPNLPFLLVQLPNFLPEKNEPSESGWAAIREAQAQAAQELTHTALAVTYDTGEWNDIHPLNKKDIAIRLFLGARKLVYGEKIQSSGPIYQKIEVDGDRIVLYFTEKGLKIRDGQCLKHFAIAGEDKKFVWAEAVIKGNKIIVHHEAIKRPVAVRYAWSDNPQQANLMNMDGLLAVPFRTDNW
ncbi:sialate O-acetylesterase [Sphingobacterium sp. lm-10]|uniref:sialate O-acetylesterase n=1 Tax=Sphingobacterium sp. lm-10 TaxID=2944904 RepID=UPI0020201F69|nr:sialate O-acetylesterase [Sphingobacterium sp. lm-10]MCL7986677.1 sialate O-acetylesterase [Sphingobacterium sp. lm-10]